MNQSQARWIGVVLLVLAGVLILWLSRSRPAPPVSAPGGKWVIGKDLPDPRLTPGDVLTTDTRKICVPGYTKTVRNVPQALKEQVYKEYGITVRKPGEYEVDHLISLELGGSNSTRNLWPQSYVTKPLNAHVKDTLENTLHDLACSGKISIQEAQKTIAENWIAAYQKYVGPLPTR